MGSDFALPGGTKYIEFFVCLFVVTFFDDKKMRNDFAFYRSGFDIVG